MDTSWWVLGGIVVAAAIGWALYLRSLRRWRDTEPTSPDAKQAEARLWSTRSNEQR